MCETDAMLAKPKVRVKRTHSSSTIRSKVYPVAGVSHDAYTMKLQFDSPAFAYSENLLGHAKLYCFAMVYMIYSLKQLCLHLLHRDMLQFNVTPDTVAAATELIEYTYANTIAVDSNGENHYTGDYIRDLVVEFAFENHLELSKLPLFKQLLYDGGHFVVDLFERLARES